MADGTQGRIFQAGAEAHERGLGRTRCPYPASAPERSLWLQGWDDADRQVADGEEPQQGLAALA